MVGRVLIWFFGSQSPFVEFGPPEIRLAGLEFGEDAAAKPLLITD